MGALLFVAAWMLTTTFAFSPPPDLGRLLLAGVGVLCLLALSVTRYDAVVGFAFVLSSVVIGVPTPSDLILFVVILAALATGRLAPRVPVIVAVCLGLFVAINILATAAADNLQIASNYLMIVISLAAVAVWVSGYIDSPRRARIIVGGYLASALFAATAGSLALLTPIPGRDLFLYGIDETVLAAAQEGVRVRALFDDPNVFGPFLMPITMILLEDLLRPRLFGFSRILKAVMLSVLLAGIVFSASRGAWLSVLIALIVFIAVTASRQRGSKRVVPLLGGIVAAAMMVGSFVTLAGDQSDIGDRAGSQEYDVSRWDAQEQGLHLAWTHPLGIGPGQFEEEASYGGEQIAAHSLFIRAFAEEGLLGLLSLVALCLATLGYALRAAIRGVDLHGIGSAALLASWSGILIHSYFVDSLQWRHAWLVAALIWASAFVASRSTATRQPA